jgi:hypothetical protein
MSYVLVAQDSLCDIDVMTLSFDEILNLRQDSTGLYFNFIEFFIAPVVGKIFYKDNCCEKMVSEFISVSDEAFALLIFENSYETWCDMLKTNNTKNSGVFCKYTNGGSSTGRNASSRRYQGWNAEGIKRFNVLFDLVKADRTKSHARFFEDEFKVYCENGGVSGKKKKKNKVVFEAIHVCHELWSDDEENEDGVYPSGTKDNHGKVQVDEEESETPLPVINGYEEIVANIKEEV